MSLNEFAFATEIADWLVDRAGYTAGAPAHFDPGRGIDTRVGRVYRGDADRGVEPANHAAWRRPHTAQRAFADRLATELDARGTVDVLRRGVVDLGVTIQLAYFRPAHGLAPDLVKRYEANQLTVTRPLRYEATSAKALDLALFVNGLPVATAEVKNPLTGQNVEDAKAQYRTDRDAGSVTLARRAVVHFAVDPEQVAMTTRLAGQKTRFLPFNRGHDHGAGNPPVPDGHRAAYLWRDVWSRDNWLEVLQRFVHVEQQPRGSRLRPSVIFPRYHPWDAVRLLEAAARAEGAGNDYLVEHSAGSGKSNTIAWLAHRLSTLHGADDNPVFDKVVVITDRRVLDKQLQDTIHQFDHAHGVIEKIDEDSVQLADALAGAQARIIITTLQKFRVVMKQGVSLTQRKYAVIVDEAHSSQTGEGAKDLKVVLGAGPRSDIAEDEQLRASEAADASVKDHSEDPVADALADAVRARTRQRNISFFAFTATPKGRTLEQFGRLNPATGNHDAFHLYSMRQAIEEGFVSFTDTKLEGDYLCCKALAAFIRPAGDAGLDLGSEVELTHLRTERTFAGSLALDATHGEVTAIFSGAGSQHRPDEEPLSKIIASLNAGSAPRSRNRTWSASSAPRPLAKFPRGYRGLGRKGL